MEVYVVRHGEAEAASAPGGDAGRALTSAGAQELAGVALGLRSLGVGLDRLFASPLLRARQSAEILAEGLDGPVAEELAELAPEGGGPEALLETLAGAGERVALVGHQPTLGLLVTLAVSGVARDGAALGPGAVARLEFGGRPRAGGARLGWLMSAEQLVRLGSAGGG